MCDKVFHKYYNQLMIREALVEDNILITLCYLLLNHAKHDLWWVHSCYKFVYEQAESNYDRAYFIIL